MPNLDHRLGDPLYPISAMLRQKLIMLAGWVVGSVLLIGAISAGAVAVSGSAAWWDGWLAALLVSLIAAVISIVPLALGMCVGMQTTIAGFFAGMIIRMLLTLGGCMAAIWACGAPPKATLLLASPFYLAQLVAECTVLTKLFWTTSPTARV